jgi:hypothetical protein
VKLRRSNLQNYVNMNICCFQFGSCFFNFRFQGKQLQFIRAILILQQFLGAFAKLRKTIISFVMSVRPHGTTRLPLDRFSWNLIFAYFSKICEENSSFIRI